MHFLAKMCSRIAVDSRAAHDAPPLSEQPQDAKYLPAPSQKCAWRCASDTWIWINEASKQIERQNLPHSQPVRKSREDSTACAVIWLSTDCKSRWPAFLLASQIVRFLGQTTRSILDRYQIEELRQNLRSVVHNRECNI